MNERNSNVRSVLWMSICGIEETMTASFDLTSGTALLRQAAEGLMSISAETEQDFLLLGDQIYGVSTQFKNNSAEVGDVEARIQSGEGWQLDEVETLFREGGREVGDSTTLLTGTLPSLHDLTGRTQSLEQVGGFLMRLAHAVRIIGVLMNLQGQQHSHPRAFVQLSEGITTLAGHMADTRLSMTWSAEQAQEEFFTVMRQVRLSELMPLEAEALQRQVEDGVREMRSLMRKVVSSCSWIRKDSEEIVPYLNQVVMAVQFHDITRQQMEHVSQALLLAGTRLEDGTVASRRWAKQCLEIQLGQLAYVLHKTDEVEQQVDARFRDISERAQNQVSRVGEILGLEGPLSAGVRQLDLALQALLQTLRRSEGVTRRVLEAMEEVNARLRLTREHLESIEDIGNDLRRMSVNAMLLPNDAGEQSLHLEKLSHEVIHRSEEAQTLLSREVSTLQEGLELIAGFQEALEQSLDQQLESVGRTRASLNERLQGFREASVAMLARTGAVSRETWKLAGGILTLLENLSFGEQVELRVRLTYQLIELLHAELEHTLEPETEVPSPLDLSELEHLYSRDVERTIHQSCLQEPFQEVLSRLFEGWDPAEKQAETAPAEASEEDLLDDVEFF